MLPPFLPLSTETVLTVSPIFLRMWQFPELGYLSRYNYGLHAERLRNWGLIPIMGKRSHFHSVQLWYPSSLRYSEHRVEYPSSLMYSEHRVEYPSSLRYSEHRVEFLFS
jgi:hypothetical protein